MALEVLGKRLLTRATTNELSEIAELLRRHNTVIVVIGVMEDAGSFQSFMDGNYLDGEVYTGDEQLYQDIGFKPYSCCGLCCLACTCCCRSAVRSQMKGIRDNKIDGDLVGNPFRNGGTLIIKDNQLLLSHIQETADDHVEVIQIVNILGLTLDQSLKIVTKQPRTVCNDEVCRIRRD
ncbi:DgyrCDS4396 [Dimorphilus gyrociliatus]|uniref:DgyrCDS4396 n=1 Tax=Dimorphilus gyrociliatus TaxID=2664684 RepID=A0A7I8VID3_9ANNE|nr:DgyrCDS4396 [Dimorphilus gyrociliatus]